jgi:hypothetical protein
MAEAVRFLCFIWSDLRLSFVSCHSCSNQQTKHVGLSSHANDSPNLVGIAFFRPWCAVKKGIEAALLRRVPPHIETEFDII